MGWDSAPEHQETPQDATRAGSEPSPVRARAALWLRRRISYNSCAVSATQAISGAPAWGSELLGWALPPDHQETPQDATRAGSEPSPVRVRIGALAEKKPTWRDHISGVPSTFGVFVGGFDMYYRHSLRYNHHFGLM